MCPRHGFTSLFLSCLLLAAGCGVEVATSGAEAPAASGEPAQQGTSGTPASGSGAAPGAGGGAPTKPASTLPDAGGPAPADAPDAQPDAHDAQSPQATEDAGSPDDPGGGDDSGGGDEPALEDAGGGPWVPPGWRDAGVIEPPLLGCAAWPCPDGSYCDDFGGKPHCVPSPSCDDTSCAPLQHCELIQVACFRAPCPPIPMCVSDPVTDDPGTGPCAALRCGPNTHCIAFPSCDGMRCVPQAQCVPNAPSGSCGKSSCGPGTYCCNASCGICAPRGGACTQQVCDPFR
jgi:hypothetical protein